MGDIFLMAAVSERTVPEYVRTSPLAEANLWSAAIYPLSRPLDLTSMYGTGFAGSDVNVLKTMASG